MKKFNTKQIELLSLLSDGLCHNGNELGATLQMSRTAVWKQINQLIQIGVPIIAIHQQGYQLTTPLTLLDADTILDQLKLIHFIKPIHFHLFASLGSTNRYLKELPDNQSTIDVCCAEMQTEGRGRFGREWYSPFGDNIYCSSRWHFDCDLSRLSGLSLVVSLAILATLNDLGLSDNVHVKWPNDVLWHDQKLCGNLIEVIGESNGGCDIVIGIGLNINSSTEKHSEGPDKPWCSLFDMTGKYTNRNLVIAHLIAHLDQFLNTFILEGFGKFMLQWQPIDYLLGKIVTVSQASGSIRGTANGVNETGQLILIDDAGVTHCLSSGDTSLHTLG